MSDSIIIFGADGYIGWPLAVHLGSKHPEKRIILVDNLATRKLVKSVHTRSLVPIKSMPHRIAAYERVTGNHNLEFVFADARDSELVETIFRKHRPESVVHLAQQRSAPFSMIDQEHAMYSELNNIATNMNIVYSMARNSPDAHLVKMGCYDEDTEVLTRDGWKYFFDLTYSDEICCLDPTTEEIIYDRPINIVSYSYSGKMMRVNTQNIDLLITPNHRVVYRYVGSQYQNSARAGAIKIATAEEVFGKNFMIPKSGEWNAPDAETFEIPEMNVRTFYGHRRLASVQVFRMDAWLSFFGWFIAEGSIRYRGGEPTAVYLCQKSTSPKLKCLKQAIEELKLNFSESALHSRQQEYAMSNFEISNNHLANFLAQFGRSADKYIPAELKNVSQRQLTLLFNSLMLGDGHVNKETGSMYYYSKSERLLSDVQEIAMKLGYGATICKDKRGEYIQKYLCISKHPNARARSKAQSWEDYNGVVYCCTVSTGVIMVRRNGKAAFSGNSMGEYGQPGIEIAEGELEIEHKGRKASVMFPLASGSYYHLSKIFDTFNVKLANKLFDITATDIMQGVVYGTRTDELVDDELATRFDFDSIWGTLINKYVIQAVALNKLLIYGKGKQKRGFLSLYDSINCLTLLLENPPKKGEYRIVNQLDEIYDTLELAGKVQEIGTEYGIDSSLEYVQNPRVEKEEHYYEVETKILPSLGFKRRKNLDIVLHEIFEAVLANKNRIGDARELIYPTVQWKSGRVNRAPLFKLPKEMLSIVTPQDMDYEYDAGSEEPGVQEPFEVVERPSK